MALRDVLPKTWTDASGVVEVGGVSLSAIAERFGTPAYVFDVAHLEARFSELQDAVDGLGRPVYAAKAFLCTAFAELLASNGWWADVVSVGEAAVVRRGGVPSERIVLHGNLKTDQELELAVRGEVAIVVVDSLGELERLALSASEAGAVVDVMIRLNEDVDLATHPKVLTTGRDAKFGMVPDEASRAVTHIAYSDSLRLRGVHIHSGSQVVDVNVYGVIIERLVDFVAQHLDAFSVRPILLDVGGGLAAPYLRTDPVIDASAVGDAIRSALDACDAMATVGDLEVLFEPGRSLVANAGVLLYRVGVRKGLAAGGELIALDGGMADNPRAALYGSRYELIPVEQSVDAACTTFRVFGRMCESDLLLESVELPASTATGDLLVMPAAGAYTFSMSSRYNGLARPPVLFVQDGVVSEVVRRESIEDVFAGEARLDEAPTWTYTPTDDEHR